MFKIKSKILKKLSAGFMAGLCVFSMLGSSMSGVITANAASTSTENSAFPSADTVVAKAATLLGSPYTFGNKGYWYAYNQGQYTPLSVQTINNLGIDCSGLVYYTLTQLGYSTSGFSWNNPVPVDTAHWLTVSDSCTITYNGVTSKVGVEKANIKTTDRPYWECSDGSTITPGSVVVAENPGGIDHAWIYMGEFDSRSDVVSYLKSIGVSESLITSSTVGDAGSRSQPSVAVILLPSGRMSSVAASLSEKISNSVPRFWRTSAIFARYCAPSRQACGPVASTYPYPCLMNMQHQQD